MKRPSLRIFAAVAAVAIFVATGSAQDTNPNANPKQNVNPNPKPKPKTDPQVLTDKVSYGIGLNIGRDMRSQDLQLNAVLLIKGITDGLAKAESAYSEEDIKAAMEEFQLVMRERMEKKEKEAAGKNLAEGAKFLAENAKKPGITVLPSGLQYKVMKAGNGPSPKVSDQVKTHYHGTLTDGTVFDSSVQRGKPASFGVGQVIPGWTEALTKMKVGDKWQLFIPANLAYGERGTGPIGPHSVLVFEVELLEIAAPAPPR